MLNIDFSKKTVIVTGGGTGIGYAIAESFFACGANVVLCGRREDILKQAIKDIEKKTKTNSQGKIIAIACDMSKEEDVKMLMQKTVEKFSKLDIFINNAGVWTETPIEKMKESDISNLIQSNLVATILGTKHSAQSMKNGGVIVNIGSFAGILAKRGSSVYSAVKSAVGQFTRSSAAELAEKGIRVNAVIPGVIRTPMTSDHIDEHMDEIIRAIPLGRVGEAKEVAHSVLFLASNLAEYITGDSIEVTGGKYTAQL
jgi:3-oxoacyl-[acyl-carrier protein] reductase